jgi:manganese/iron transport system substrate-binding protein
MHRELIFLMLMILLAWPLQAQEKPVDTVRRKPVLACSTTQIADSPAKWLGIAEVHCILAPGADPHTYMLTPATQNSS